MHRLIVQSEIYFSLVILCYREENHIISFVEEVHAAFKNFDFSWELILVANYIFGSSDNTPKIVRELASRLPHTKYIAKVKTGMMGWDLRQGAELACGRYVGLIDGDGQFPIHAILSCLDIMARQDMDLVKTYRVTRNDGPFRKLISNIYNRFFRLLFQTHFRDINSKPKIISNEIYKKMNLQSSDWFIDAEIMIKSKLLNLKVAELPIHSLDQSRRKSFVNLEAIFEFMFNLIAERIKLTYSCIKMD